MCNWWDGIEYTIYICVCECTECRIINWLRYCEIIDLKNLMTNKFKKLIRDTYILQSEENFIILRRIVWLSAKWTTLKAILY